MTALFCDSFDHYDQSNFYSVKKWGSFVNNPPLLSTTGGRRGGRAMRLADYRAVLHDFGANKATLVIGFALRVDTGISTRIVQWLDVGSTQCFLTVDPAGWLGVYRGDGTLLGATAAGLVVPGVYAYVEFKVTFHDTAGAAEVRMNGVSRLSLSGVDTTQSANNYANVVVFGANQPAGGDLCDLYICDTAGSVNNDFLGDVKVLALLPTGAGTNAAWTPSAGSNWDCANEVPPNDDTDYVSTATAGAKDSYVIADLPAGAGNPKFLQYAIHARKDDAGSRVVAPLVRVGGTDYTVGAGASIGDTYSYYVTVQEQNPNTSAQWTATGLNAAEAGVVLVS
jgi:hypothetical protein